jgi:hypothetical protein
MPANGWYRGSGGILRHRPAGHADRVMAQIALTFAEGTSRVVGTDAGWQWSSIYILG